MALRAVAVSALLGGATVAVSALLPAAAQQAGGARAMPGAVVTCHSPIACAGGQDTGTGIGVVGTAAKNNGVDGSTKNPSATTGGRSGVYGHDDSTDGGVRNVGVAGYSNYGIGVSGGAGTGTGMLGTSNSGIAVDGGATSGYGVWGYSGSGIGSVAVSAQSVALSASVDAGNSNNALQLVGGTNDQSGNAMQAYSSSSYLIYQLDNGGSLFIQGLLYTGGSCHNGCSRTHRVKSYAARQSMPSMEDVGEGQLVNGKARVSFDRAYANVIDRNSPYVVFITPEGPNRGLYVTHKDATGFAVMENPGGRATIPFAYRIVAKPYGVNEPRLPAMNLTQKPVVALRTMR
jgi:hypothetical protein